MSGKRDVEMDRWRAYIASMPLRKVRVPSGDPPVPLTGKISDDRIRKWGLDTRAAFREQRGEHLLCEGLIYLLRMYFIDESEHPRAVQRAEKVIFALGDS